MDRSESLFDKISSVPVPEGWICALRPADEEPTKCLQLDHLSHSAHITVKVDVAQAYAAICGIEDSEGSSSTDILNLLPESAFIEVSDCPNYSGLKTCLFYSGFGKVNSPEDGSASTILIAHHDNMVAEIRLIVTPTIDDSSFCPASKWLQTDAIQDYLIAVSKHFA